MTAKAHKRRKDNTMTEKTMTTREFLAAVSKNEITEEVISKAAALLAAHDARNEKRKSTDSKEKKEAAARRELVLNFLKQNEGAFTRDEIAAAVGIEPTKVTGACNVLVKDGLVTKTEVKVDKARKTAYALA